MPTDRAVPLTGVLPHLYYRDADAALDWLVRALGFVEVWRAREDDGRIHIAQLRTGAADDAYVMIRYTRTGELSPADAGGCTQTLMVIVADVDAHHERALAAGAEVTSAPTDRLYGVRDYELVDPDGHVWTFAQHVGDADPAVLFEVPG